MFLPYAAGEALGKDEKKMAAGGFKNSLLSYGGAFLDKAIKKDLIKIISITVGGVILIGLIPFLFQNLK